MYLYNITYLVPHAIKEKWLHWMQEEHIPEMLATGLFTHHRMLQLMEVDESEGVTFAFQLYTETASNYRKYVDLHAKQLREKAQKVWGDQVVGFRTLMKSVQ
jgi:Domain of unknown function (DUF4286)